MKLSEKNAKKMMAVLDKHYEDFKIDIEHSDMEDLFADFRKDTAEEWTVYYNMSRRIKY